MELDAIRQNRRPQMASSSSVNNYQQHLIQAPRRAIETRRNSMVRTVKCFSIAACLFFLTTAAFSNTLTLTFPDNANNGSYAWPNWGTVAENGTDVIGQPSLSGGTVTITDGKLTNVTINYTAGTWTVANMYAGDLFLDTNSDNIWNDVVSLYNSSLPANQYAPTIPVGPSTGVKTANVYSFSLAENYSTPGTASTLGYLITGATDSSTTYFGTGADFRNSQPYAVTGLTGNSINLGTATVSFGTTSVSFDIANANILVSGPITIGFATNCANDVIYATVSTVPEPGALILFGSGLIMVVGLLRRKNS
jgi:hypothetical protein